MAIIKCPECGHQISDKAPVCPSCGVEIAGKVIKCPHCGEVYFNNMEMCPNCHELNPTLTHMTQRPAQPLQPSSIRQSASVQQQASGQQQATSQPAQTVTSQPSQAVRTVAPQTPPARPARTTVPPVPPVRPQGYNNGTNEGDGGDREKKKSNRGVIIISLLFAVIVCGVFYYFYDSANKNKEQEAYEYAMQSSDPMVLQSYLDTYKDADEAHRDSIMAHLDMLKQVDQDWTNAVVSGSKEALEAYLQKYPNSPHKQEVWDKIDSIDWNVAKAADNADAYQTYLDAHADGAHIEEAENALKKVKSRDLQPEEKQMVSNVFRKFFQSINSRDAAGVASTCEDILSSLLGKSSATSQDVVTFMNKLYKDDVANMNWHINNDYQIKKREVGDEEYEYQVQFSARQDIDLTDGSKKENLFKINGVISPDGKISSFNMSKVNLGN
nr:zinc ribbon domain-containing protein [uncultured Prevotella sp.]